MLGESKTLAWGFAMAPHRLRALVRTYNLESGGQVHNVCKKFFMATLCVGDAYVSHAMQMKSNGLFTFQRKINAIYVTHIIRQSERVKKLL